MGNVERAVDFYGRTAGRYLSSRRTACVSPYSRASGMPSSSSRTPGSPIRARHRLRRRQAGGAPSPARREPLRAWTRPGRCSSRRSVARRASARAIGVAGAGRTFDLVICCGVLDFVEDAGAGLRAIRRHLAPEWRAVVSAAAPSVVGIGYALVRRMQGVRVRLYTSDRLRDIAASCDSGAPRARTLRGGSVAVVLAR